MDINLDKDLTSINKKPQATEIDLNTRVELDPDFYRDLILENEEA